MCYGGDGGTTYGADFNPTGECGDYVPAKVELGPHVAALGMRIYPADAAAAAAAGGGVGLAASASGGGASGLFPAEYRSKMFIAEHGSWNRRSAIGYRVMVSDGVSTYEEFFSFMDADGAYCGRPMAASQATTSGRSAPSAAGDRLLQLAPLAALPPQSAGLGLPQP